MVLAAAALLLPVSGASAHDVLISTSPEDGQTVEDTPEALELTFSANPTALGSQVVIEDSTGRNWAVGDIKIVDNVLTQPMSPEAPAGRYTVSWRVVSSDSHPIEGTFEFTAETGASPAPTLMVEELSQTQDQEAAVSGSFPTGPILAATAGLIVVATAAAFLARRKLASHRSS